jgi:hypothetical protein
VEFITSGYGEKYIGLLLTNIYSIQKSNPDSSITVYWQDMPIKLISCIQKAFPLVHFVKTDFDLIGERNQIISMKVNIWRLALEVSQSQNVCMLDCDTLVLRDIQHFFHFPFHIAFTVKKEKWPINTGVMLIRNKPQSRILFEMWLEHTIKIVNDEQLMRQAISSEFPYGGADQMALHRILDYDTARDSYEIRTLEGTLTLVALPCSILNETNSRPVTEEMHILHYKGGWRDVLLKGRDFPRYRPKNASMEMYTLFIRTFLEAMEHVKAINGHAFTYADANIKIPFYLDRKTLQESKLKYLLFRNCQPFFRFLDKASCFTKRLAGRFKTRQMM